MDLELISKAVKTIGQSIKQEDQPYSGIVYFSSTMWERYLEETEEWAKRTKSRLPENFRNITTGSWSNQSKSVVLCLVLADITSPELEAALFATLTRTAHDLTKKLHEASKLIPVQRNPTTVSRQSDTHAS